MLLNTPCLGCQPGDRCEDHARCEADVIWHGGSQGLKLLMLSYGRVSVEILTFLPPLTCHWQWRATRAMTYLRKLEGVVMSFQRALGTPTSSFHIPQQAFLRKANRDSLRQKGRQEEWKGWQLSRKRGQTEPRGRGEVKQRKSDRRGKTRQEEDLGDTKGERTGLRKGSPTENLCSPTLVCISLLGVHSLDSPTFEMPLCPTSSPLRFLLLGKCHMVKRAFWYRTCNN